MSGVVTEARFDTGEAVPVLRFTAVRPLTREEVAVAREQSASEAAMQAIEVRYTPRQAQPTAAALPANFAAAPAPAAVHPDTYEVEPKPAVEPVKRASKATPPPAAQPARSIEDTLKDWGSDDE
jgi:hypothetical protein